MIREHDFLGQTWFVVSREFPTPAAAKQAWNDLETLGERERGALELGVYRHEFPDQGPRFVAAVGHVRRGAEVADERLGGVDLELPGWVAEAMIARRIRVMAELQQSGAEQGVHIVRRPDSRGGHLRPDGTIDEQIGRG